MNVPKPLPRAVAFRPDTDRESSPANRAVGSGKPGLRQRLALAAAALAAWVAVVPGSTCLAAPPAAGKGGLTAEQVAAAVETWVHGVTADARPDAAVARMEPYGENGETVAYVAYLTDGGFCLAGADYLVLPVYYYSPHGTYDPANPNLRAILDEIGGRLAAYRKAQVVDAAAKALAEPVTERTALWDALVAGNRPAASKTPKAPQSAPALLVLPVTSTWDQGSPYNDQLPELTPGADEHVVTGCNATATAQIMYYWK